MAYKHRKSIELGQEAVGSEMLLQHLHLLVAGIGAPCAGNNYFNMAVGLAVKPVMVNQGSEWAACVHALFSAAAGGRVK